MKIDVHAHYFPERFIERQDGSSTGYGIMVTGAGGHTVYNVPPRSSASDADRVSNIGRRLQEMDEQGVDLHMLSVLPTMLNYDIDPSKMGEVCRLTNDAFAETVAANPKRLQALAFLPMQQPEDAAKELERCVKGMGFRGAMIYSNINGTNLDDNGFAPFYKMVQNLDVPVFIHPRDVLGQDRLSSYHLGNLIGNPTDTAAAAASLIFGGVLKEMPRLKFYLAHGGGTCPLLRGRWEHGWSVRPEAKVHIQRPPSEYFRLLYFDSLTHSIPALQYLVQTVGAERVMLGSDYPADMADAQPAKRIGDLPDVTDREKELMYGGNAEALFKL